MYFRPHASRFRGSGYLYIQPDIDALTWKKAFRHAYMPLIQIRDVTQKHQQTLR